MTNPQIEDIDEAWDNRALGADEAHVMVADEAHEAALDAALGLQPVAIHLPKPLID